MSQEMWAPIGEYPGYEISNRGRVRSLDRLVPCHANSRRISRGQMLQVFVSRPTGYMQIALASDRHSVHRLVAKAFCPGWFDGAVVNHKNGVRDDNRAENLEWVTHSYNLRHAYSHLGKEGWAKGLFSKDHNTSKAIVSRCMVTGKETFYWCGLDAVRDGGFDSSSISRCCNGIWKHHKNHYWRFASGDECMQMAESESEVTA